MSIMEIATRVCIGWVILIAGVALYGFAKYQVVERNDVSWDEVIIYLVLAFLGIGVLSIGDKILAWEALPELVRWGVIGFMILTSVVCYVRLNYGIEAMSDNEALTIYIVAFALFLMGGRLALLEFGIEP